LNSGAPRSVSRQIGGKARGDERHIVLAQETSSVAASTITPSLPASGWLR
jgi:hypothetical protein